MNINIGTVAVVVTMLLLMLYSGLLFDTPMFRNQCSRMSLRNFGGLAVANYVAIPLLTLFAIWLFSFPPVLNMVLLALAMLPCAPLVPAMVSMSGEPPEWSLFVFLSMSVLSIAMVPVLIAVLAIPWVAGKGTGLGEVESEAIIKYLASVYGPMGLGAAIRIFAPRQAILWQRYLKSALPKLIFISLALFVYFSRYELLALSLRDLEALILFESICIVVGLVFTRLIAGHRITCMVVSTMRNFAMGTSFTIIVYPHTAGSYYMLMFTTLIIMGGFTWIGIQNGLRHLRHNPD